MKNFIVVSSPARCWSRTLEACSWTWTSSGVPTATGWTSVGRFWNADAPVLGTADVRTAWPFHNQVAVKKKRKKTPLPTLFALFTSGFFGFRGTDFHGLTIKAVLRFIWWLIWFVGSGGGVGSTVWLGRKGQDATAKRHGLDVTAQERSQSRWLLQGNQSGVRTFSPFNRNLNWRFSLNGIPIDNRVSKQTPVQS